MRDKEEVLKKIKKIGAICMKGPNKGRLYGAYQYEGVSYWSVEDAVAGIPAAVRSGMPGFDGSEYLIDEEKEEEYRNECRAREKDNASEAAEPSEVADLLSDQYK